MNISLISSPGGHLTKTLSLMEAFRGCDVYVIALDFPNIKGVVLEGLKKLYRIKVLFGYSGGILNEAGKDNAVRETGKFMTERVKSRFFYNF
jgi:hypothetical protein